MYEKTTLPNGLRIVSSYMPHTRSVTVSIFVGVGSRFETDTEAGLSHFIEHLYFKGTDKRPTPREISEAIEGVGGYMNAATNREYTEYWCKVAQPHFSIAADVLTDALLRSRFDPSEVEKERKVVIEELNMVRDDPSEWLGVVIDETLWPDHPLGRDIAGSKETVSAFTRETAREFMQTHYSPTNCVVSVAGNLEHPVVVEEMSRLLGDWQPVTVPGWEPARDGQTKPQVRVEYKKTEQANLCVALPSISLMDPDRYKLSVLNVILGGGMSSRLFLELRERQALCYDVSSHVAPLLDTGALMVFAGVDPKRCSPAIDGILAELRGMCAPIPETEMTKAREFLKGQILLSMEGTAAVAAWMGRQELQTGRIMTPDEVVERICEVTSDDVNAVAARIFKTEKLNLAIVGPYRSDRKFAAGLHF